MTTVHADSRLGNVDWTDNFTLGFGPRIEIMEQATAKVWLCQSAVTNEQVAALSIPDGYVPALSGEAVADAAFFARSPHADVDGPLDTMCVDGLRFTFVARPVGREPVGQASALLTIDKHHTMLYRSGREIEILDFGDGTVATPAWSNPARAAGVTPELAEGWSIRTVELIADLIAVIPNPATVAFLNNGSGFHGPIPQAKIRETAKAWQ